MSVYASSSTQQPAAICALKSPADAIHILEAVRLGLVPRVTRRLTGHERSMIRPGTVWVWEEEETNMRRWTDGRRWGASRVGGGGFLVYTESSDSHSPPPRNDSPHHAYPNYNAPPGHYSNPKQAESLVKQTYSTTMTHPVTAKFKKFHVVAYSSKHNPQGDAHNPLPLPHQLPLLANLKIPPGIWPEWEHRREEVYAGRRRDGPGPQSAPVTAFPSPEAHAYRHPTSPGGHEAYPYPGPGAGRQAPFYPGRPDPYMGRHMSQPPAYPPNERYHPYYTNGPRPGGGGLGGGGGGGGSGVAPGGAGGRIPSEPYYRDRDPSPSHPYGQPYPSNQYPSDPYAASNNGMYNPRTREYYLDEAPPLQQAAIKRSPEINTRPPPLPNTNSNINVNGNSTSTSERNSNGTLQPPAGPMMPDPTVAGRSPKMSIGSNLLNPDSVTSGGLTLPPLRMTIDERTTKVNNSAGVGVGIGEMSETTPISVSVSVSGKMSPRSPSGGSVASTGMSLGMGSEDRRQLGELGYKVAV
ncbi:Gti1/Pac2 family-domain-containing protein [Naematelia encephala]|uniref:Gti1/Pac2 family-domain-containing protein n=1 Tax=Naematelia encephala TaxID=71784 RepID=A0A1Y2BE96_9TREE|nr:Gti1/Pac2 family-domain-containing protein [Naematelia encephala]